MLNIPLYNVQELWSHALCTGSFTTWLYLTHRLTTYQINYSERSGLNIDLRIQHSGLEMNIFQKRPRLSLSTYANAKKIHKNGQTDRQGDLSRPSGLKSFTFNNRNPC